MKKLLLILASLSALASATFAQSQAFLNPLTPPLIIMPPARFISHGAAPPASCTAGFVFEDTSGVLYTCVAGVPTAISGGGNITASGAVVAGCDFEVAASAASAPYTAINGHSCFDATKNGLDYLQGVTSGGVAFSVANIAGTAVTLIWPTDSNGAANATVLTMGAAATCPTLLPVSAPATCRYLTWTAPSVASTIEHVFPAAGGSSTIPILLWSANNNGTMTSKCDLAATNPPTTTQPTCTLNWYQADATINWASFGDVVPASYSGGAISIDLWFMGNTFGETVAFTVEYACSASGSDWFAESFSTAQAFGSQATSGSNIYKKSVTLTGSTCAADNTLDVIISRTDTAGYGRILRARLRYAI